MSIHVPRTTLQEKRERVIDARCCVLSGCRFLQTAYDPATGQAVRSCGAGVWKAELPAEKLQQEVRRNPDPLPGAGQEENPFLLRLLMAPECLRPECGMAQITHRQRVLEVDPHEQESSLFS